MSEDTIDFKYDQCTWTVCTSHQYRTVPILHHTMYRYTGFVPRKQHEQLPVDNQLKTWVWDIYWNPWAQYAEVRHFQKSRCLLFTALFWVAERLSSWASRDKITCYRWWCISVFIDGSSVICDCTCRLDVEHIICATTCFILSLLPHKMLRGITFPVCQHHLLEVPSIVTLMGQLNGV